LSIFYGGDDLARGSASGIGRLGPKRLPFSLKQPDERMKRRLQMRMKMFRTSALPVCSESHEPPQQAAAIIVTNINGRENFDE